MSQRSNSPKSPPPFKILQRVIHSNADDLNSSFASIKSRTTRRRSRSGSQSPPPFEPKLNQSSKKQFIPVPQQTQQPQQPQQTQQTQQPQPQQPQAIIKKETVEVKTSSVPTVLTVPSVPSTQPIKQGHRHYTLKTSNEKAIKCSFCEEYCIRPYVVTTCCNEPYHPGCLSMLYSETISFGVKNGTTRTHIYLNHECGFTNEDEEGRNVYGLTNLVKYFELGIKNYGSKV